MTLTVVFYDRDNNETGRAPVHVGMSPATRVIMPAGSVAFELLVTTI